MNINIMIVSHRHFAGEDIAEVLREHINSHPIEGANVRFHVVYRVPYAVSMIPNMDIVIGNMHIKKSDKQCISDGIYHSIREMAQVYDICHIRASVAKHMPQKVVRAIKHLVEQKSQAVAKDLA